MDDVELYIALLDDEKEAIGMIEGALRIFFQNKHINAKISSFVSSSVFLKYAQNTRFDLLLSDIEMPEENGISVVEKFKERFPDSEVIFLSNREDKVFESLKVHPFGFIRKKNFFQDVERILSEFLNVYLADKKQEGLVVQQGNELVTILLKDITYVESDKKRQHLHLSDGRVIVTHTTMKALESDLTSKGFIQCHKAFLVNYRYIYKIDDENIFLNNGEKVFLSRRKVTEVKQRYLELVQKDFDIIIRT